MISPTVVVDSAPPLEANQEAPERRTPEELQQLVDTGADLIKRAAWSEAQSLLTVSRTNRF